MSTAVLVKIRTGGETVDEDVPIEDAHRLEPTELVLIAATDVPASDRSALLGIEI